MKVLKAVRVSALFVGSVVGAGFATGQEVLLFFGGDGVISLVAASLFMATCVFAFMEIGAKEALPPRVGAVTEGVVSLSSFAVYAAMIAASEEVLFDLTGQGGLSLFLAVSVAFLSYESAERLSFLNLVALPVMVGVMVLVGARSGGKVSGGTHLLTAFAYGGMNLLFSGALMTKEGEGCTRAERLVTAAVSGAVIFVMLLFMRRCVSVGGDMPFLAAADREGLGTFARVALLLAILTTMASCFYLGLSRLRAWTGDGVLSASLMTLLGVTVAGFGFAPIVAATYPVISYLGLAATLFALGYTFLSPLLARFFQKNPFRNPARGIDRGQKS